MTIQWDRVPGVLRTYRDAAGLTQAALAKAIGVRSNTIARLESGNRRPSIDLLEQLADVFGCGVADLLPETKTRRKTKGGR